MNNIKNLDKFVDNINLNRAISCVLVTPEHIVATDSYKLIEVEHGDDSIKENVLVRLPKKIKTFTGLMTDNGKTSIFAEYPILVETNKDEFPKYQEIIPSGKIASEMELNPKYLKDICEAFIKDEKMKITIYEDKKEMLVITGKNKRALLMAIK